MIDARVLDAMFAAPLRGEEASWPAGWDAGEALEAARRRLIYHGIAGLLHERRTLLKDWPEAILATIREESVAHAMWELRHKMLIAEIVERLHAAGITSVLLKGTALAYSLYDNPAHRFRGDSDLLVRQDDLEIARVTLAALKWQRTRNTHGLFGDMHYQEIWQYQDPAGLTHDIDLHWEVTNSLALKSVLDVDQALPHAVPLPALSPHALQLDPATALLHGCINRAVHMRSGYFSIDRNEYDPDRLLWAYDLHLQMQALRTDQWQVFAAISLARGVGAISFAALEYAREALATKIPSPVLAQLAKAPVATPATNLVLEAGPLERGLADFRATPGFNAKLGFILARAFPSPDFVRSKYPDLARWPLALLYMRRQWSAFGRLMRKLTN